MSVEVPPNMAISNFKEDISVGNYCVHLYEDLSTWEILRCRSTNNEIRDNRTFVRSAEMRATEGQTYCHTGEIKDDRFSSAS